MRAVLVTGTETNRLVAVLGYSGRRGEGLHSLCLLRLRHAEQIAGDARAVVLSGWARGGRPGEAELMRAAWRGPDVPVVCDTTARNTVENAAGVAAVARELNADEVVVVTSRWHAPRARVLVRAALHGTGYSVRTSSPRIRLKPKLGVLVLRELVCIAVLPLQVLRVHASAGRRRLD